MANRILIQCPHCAARLSITDENKLGKRLRCSKCSEVFVAKAIKPAASKSDRQKPKKSADDELNFDDMEMEDLSMSGYDDSEAGALPPREKKSPTGKNRAQSSSSGGKVPFIIAGSILIVLLGIAGVFFFRDSEPDSAVAPNQQAAVQSKETLNGADGVVANSPEVSPLTGETAVSGTIPTTPVRKSNKAERLGETTAVSAINSSELPVGTKGLTARTRWYWTTGLDVAGVNQDVIELVLDVQGDLLSKACAFGHAEITTLHVVPGQTLEVFRAFDQDRNWRDPLLFYVPYDSSSSQGRDGRTESQLTVEIPFVAPKLPATQLALVEGQFKLRIGHTVEEIVIPDLRAFSNQPFDHPSLKAAKAELRFRTQSLGGSTGEVVDFRIGPNYAVGPLEIKTSRSNVELEPDHVFDPSGQFFTTSKMLSLPEGPLKLVLKLYSDFEEIAVPFRFENVPLPDFAKKPK